MRSTTKRTYIVILLIVAFFGGLGFMLYSFITDGDTWVSNRANALIYSGGELTVAGTIYDRDGEVMVSTQGGKRTYNDSYNKRVSTLHVVGDSSGYIATGVQTLYRSNLIGYNFIDGIYKTLSSDEGIDIKLTIDADVCAEAYSAMNGKKGTVVVYNYQTGEVICMVSAPTYDPTNKPSDINTNTSGKYDGIYLNRAISGVFTPGSTFKVVTAVCAIENIPDIYSRSFTCTGKYKAGSGYVICNGVHGKVNFERALNVSCNSVFAQLANEVGKDKLTETVRALGFGKSVTISKAKTVRSTFDVSNSTKLDLGWAGIGQYTTLVNPCQMLMFMGAIANGGVAMTPYLVEESSEIIDQKSKQNTNIKLSAETAEKVKKLLRSNVKNYYSDNKFPNLEMCGKTGSAEVSNGKSHAWFVGFSQRSKFPYAIVVCLENGGIGYNDAIPVANKVMQKVLATQK
ncbi:MAG: penicillin-binding transpeptidase domain-containing protein [Oscillospiraceae bacterium]|nr:penicillin-binding transpeptidase domain-containing protein [Oscillospiraceae bacterium]MDD6146103.1 penicillin-binding transpeptidase domain-containing protein [Oscillospiraceae bacterium]